MNQQNKICCSCENTVTDNNVICSHCLYKAFEKKRKNRTLRQCWYCDDSDNNKFKIDEMCDFCNTHKIAIKAEDIEFGIIPFNCYCCDSGLCVSDLDRCDFCNRNCCSECHDFDKKRNTISCFTCQPPLSVVNRRIIMVSGKTSHLINSRISFLRRIGVKFETKNTDNNKRKSLSPNNSNKKQKKSTKNQQQIKNK